MPLPFLPPSTGKGAIRPSTLNSNSDDDVDEHTSSGARNFAEEVDFEESTEEATKDMEIDQMNKTIRTTTAYHHSFQTNMEDPPTSPFKLISTRKKKKDKNADPSRDEIMSAFMIIISLGSRGACKN